MTLGVSGMKMKLLEYESAEIVVAAHAILIYPVVVMGTKLE